MYAHAVRPLITPAATRVLTGAGQLYQTLHDMGAIRNRGAVGAPAVVF